MARTSSNRPNVLLVTVDQWPGYAMGCAGHPAIETPAIDRLAHVGTRFTRAYSECPVCIPARRSLMTGTTARTHGDRVFQTALEMPRLPTLADCFRGAGYQTTAIGKLHVYPKRNRIGFDDAIIAEEGRGHLGGDDDYDIFLSDHGYTGQQFMHGMGNNDYAWRTWHLPERMHVTNWTTATAARAIKRRDPTRPGFWHVSYTHPHPPLVPLQSYMDRYDGVPLPPPVEAPWAGDDRAPYAVRAIRRQWEALRPHEIAKARQAVLALSTHIDHQLRIVIGTLREEELLGNTAILFCSDHGDMLGDFGLFAKRLMYEGSANIPMILVEPANSASRGADRVSDRLVGLQDVMPTLLDLAGIDIPPHCEGLSMIGNQTRDVFYGEVSLGPKATRMVTDGRYKLIWYPAGNVVQLFDLQADPRERNELSADPAHAEARARLTQRMIDHLYGEDLQYVDGGKLVGTPAPEGYPARGRGLAGQRGLHYPQIPQTDPSIPVGPSSD